MRRTLSVAVAVLAVAGALVPSAAAGGSSPSGLRIRLGSSRTQVTVGWYLGLWQAFEDGSVELGVRLILSRAPRPTRPRPLPGRSGVVAFEPAPRRPAPVPGAVESLAGAVVAYGMLPGRAGLDSFLAGEGP